MADSLYQLPGSKNTFIDHGDGTFTIYSSDQEIRLDIAESEAFHNQRAQYLQRATPPVVALANKTHHK